MVEKTKLTAEKIEEWLIDYLAESLKIGVDEVDVKTPFTRYGLDSSEAIIMTGDLGEFLGFEVDATLPYDYPNIESLARTLGNLKLTIKN